MSITHEVGNMITVDQAIDICLNPNYASHNLLQAILRVIVTKLNLEGTIIVLDSEKKPPSRDDQLENVQQLKDSGKVQINIKSTVAPENNPINLTKSLRQNEVPNTNQARLSYLETALGKITRLLSKLTTQHEHLAKNSVKVSFEDSSAPIEMISSKLDQKYLSDIGYDQCWNPREFFEKDLDNLRKEFKRNFCELSKKVMRMNGTIEEHKDAVNKMRQVGKVLDRVAPKDYVNCLNDKIECLVTQISKIRKDIGKINIRIEDIVECAKYTEKRIKDIQDRNKMLDKIREICEKLNRFDEWIKKIHEELERFTEITEYLKITKANKEELDYLFEEKADRDELLKLVTLEFFKSVQDDLSSGIVQVLEQLMRDEIEWEKAQKEIQLMLDAKADECEVTSLKKYINCKLEIIQKKLNDIIRNRLTAHAAAVKIRLLKDARCISCTAEADLNQLKYPVPMLAPVTYREFKCLCEPRNRYCGGSHTMVGNDQKLIRRQKMTLKSNAATTTAVTLSEGTDGRLYRTREQKCICMPIEPKEEETIQKKELFPC